MGAAIPPCLAFFSTRPTPFASLFLVTLREKTGCHKMQQPTVAYRSFFRQCYGCIAQFQTVKDQVRVCKLWDQQLLIHVVRKSTPRFTRFLSLVLIRLVFTEIQRFKNAKIYKEMYGHPDVVRQSVRMPFISLLILAFLNRCISVKTSLISTKLGNLVNLGVLFLTMWINSC